MSDDLSPSEQIDAMIARIPDWRGAAAARLRRIVHEADPGIIEEVKWKRPTNPSGAPVFEHNGIVCTLAILKGRVRLTLGEGALIPDPHGLYNAALEGNKMRGIDLHEGDDIDEEALRELVRAAVDRNVAKPIRTK